MATRQVMEHVLQVIVSALGTVPTGAILIPVGFGRKSLDTRPDERPVNVSGLHRFQRRAAADS
jgi:hypothetical protein